MAYTDEVVNIEIIKLEDAPEIYRVSQTDPSLSTEKICTGGLEPRPMPLCSPLGMTLLRPV
jgi:hypothetical protein